MPDCYRSEYIFEEEINIVKPDIIIALGQRSIGWVSVYLIMKKSSLKPYELMHYSQRRDIKSYKDKFVKNLKEITGNIQNLASC